jgi:hypothetical protein
MIRQSFRTIKVLILRLSLKSPKEKWHFVATPLWGKCKDEIHTPEIGTWESSETPETSEFNCRGQNTLYENVLYIIEKLLKFRCRKWLHMGHLDICNTSYGKKEGSGVKLAVWLPTIKSWESTRHRCVQVECDTPLESSQGKLKLCFKPHPD